MNNNNTTSLKTISRNWIKHQIIDFYLNYQIKEGGVSIGEFLQTDRTIEDMTHYFDFHPIAVKRFLNCWIGLHVVHRQQEHYQTNHHCEKPDNKYSEHIIEELKTEAKNATDHHTKDYLKYFFEILWLFFQPEVLLAAIQTNESQWLKAKGLNVNQVFELYSQQPELPQLYARLFSQSNFEGDKAFFQMLNVEDNAELLDIGSGIGQQSERLLSLYPNVNQITLYEFDKARELFIPYFDTLQSKYPGKLSIVFGDFFKDQNCSIHKGLYRLPPDAKFDCIFLNWVLHDWDDEHCDTILKKATSHLRQNGKIIISESILDENGIGKLPIYDILMLITANGVERTLKQYKRLLKNAGLKVDKVILDEKERDVIIASSA